MKRISFTFPAYVPPGFSQTWDHVLTISPDPVSDMFDQDIHANIREPYFEGYLRCGWFNDSTATSRKVRTTPILLKDL